MERNRIIDILESNKTQDIRKFKSMFCGKELNRGTTRMVYEFVPDPRYVVKIQYNDCLFANVIEYEIWSELEAYKKYSHIKQYFAPSIWISKNGKILIQRRVRHKARKESYPKMIPSFFNDCKLTNYGWIGNRFVCCDYGNFSLVKGLREMKKKKAEWWQLAPNKFKMK